MTGCFSPSAVREAEKANWKPAEYTIDDLINMGLERNGKLDNLTDDDCTGEALNAYNIMLGYVESVTNMDYKIYDFYHVDFDAVKSYVVKIVVGDKIEEVENSSEPLSANDKRSVMLSCNEDGKGVKSQLETYLMARKWTEDLAADLAEQFPDYHMNTRYINIEYMSPHVQNEKYTDIYDYTYFYKDDFYKNKHQSYDNGINIIVPAGTAPESSQEIYEELKGILTKYCVTEADILSPANPQAYEKMLEEEQMTGNSYKFKADKNYIQWLDTFKITDE